jgi:hypothetical protein
LKASSQSAKWKATPAHMSPAPWSEKPASMSAVCDGMMTPNAVRTNRPTAALQVRNIDPQDSIKPRDPFGDTAVWASFDF